MNPIREEAIRYAQECGFKAGIGKTDKNGNYTPYVNALFKEVPVEWIEKLIEKVKTDTLTSRNSVV